MGIKARNIIDINQFSETFEWYTIVTKFNYEQKFARDLKDGLAANGMTELINDVLLPVYEETELVVDKHGKEKVKKKTINVYPSYVFVRAKMTPDVWAYIRKTSGCSTILAIGSSPAITQEREINEIKKMCGCYNQKTESSNLIKSFNKNDEVKIIKGIFNGFKGIIDKLDNSKFTAIISFENGFTAEVAIDSIELS